VQDSLNITHGEEMAFVQGSYKMSREQSSLNEPLTLNDEMMTISCGLRKGVKKQFKRDKKDYQRLIDHIGLIPLVMISPADQQLIDEGSDERRRFMDVVISQLDRRYIECLQQYNALLKQRNAALQQVRHYTELRPWDIELVKLAEIVSQLRAKYAEILRPEIEQTCRFFLPELEISVSFHRGWDKQSDYAEILAQGFERDRNLGYTMIGPQKADFRFKANGLPVEDVLSRGQLKLLMCALRLAQGEHLIQQKQRQCLFLIDDFASELDPVKRELLAHRLRQSGSQVFVTAITREQLNQMHFQEQHNDKLFFVENGEIKEAD
jgi:DNA replication and repair protein RecF